MALDAADGPPDCTPLSLETLELKHSAMHVELDLSAVRLRTMSLFGEMKSLVRLLDEARMWLGVALDSDALPLEQVLHALANDMVVVLSLLPVLAELQ